MKKHITLLFCAFCLSISFAQKTDKNVYPEPTPPTLPSAGGIIVDPTFGTSIMRVTDATDGTDNHQAYSYWPAHNMNSTQLFISAVSGQALLYDFDPVNFTISNKRKAFFSTAPDGGSPSSEDAIWSGTNPDVILCHTGQNLYAYNIVTKTYTLLHDFSADYSDIHLWQMSRSLNDSVFAFTRKENVNWTEQGYVVWKKGSNLISFNTSSIDEVQIDKTGQYLVYKTGNSGANQIEVIIRDLKNNTSVNLTDNGPDFSPGHSDNGQGVVAGADNWNNQMTFRNLSSPHTFYPVMEFGNDWTHDYHISMLADDETYFSASLYSDNSTPALYRNEIVLVPTDGSEIIQRLCHHQSVYDNDYYNSPRACRSRDGKFITFTSTWGTTTRKDVFILKVPDLTTGIPQTNKYPSFNLYPNPASNQLTISYTNNGGSSGDHIVITNAIGEIILEKNTTASLPTAIDLSGFDKGVYFIRLNSSSWSEVRKFIKE